MRWWHNHWNDDGDTFTVTGGGVGLAHFGDPTRPAVVLGNQGRTLAMPCWDEAGDTWLNDGSGALLWENVFDLMALGGCTPTASSATVRLGFPANPDVLHPVAPGGPVLGSEFQVVVDHSLWMPTAILDVASVCVFQMNLSTSAGTLLVDLSTQVVSTFVNAGQPIAFPVPVDCALVGLPASIQVGSVAVGDLQLTNALDLVIGNQ